MICKFLADKYVLIVTNKIVLKPLNINLSTSKAKFTKIMENIVDVDIDNSGRFKYVLIKIMDANNRDKYIVRGYSWASYHGDIVDSLEPQFAANKVSYDCVGGGRIIHKPEDKTIKVFGYSQGFGKADHSITCRLLKEHFKDYKSIEWSDDGY